MHINRKDESLKLWSMSESKHGLITKYARIKDHTVCKGAQQIFLINRNIRVILDWI